ncbi:glycoside hydrolase family 65 protein [Zunongwangia sp. SCSIO 43204]|uniref:glycoside hydrolase family 65 protein n=1 Tax=Zunongwangia sp. SCSIO 43204 TaxID=2779359 RepID=UPI001CA908C7|nr:glycosyl hydrolase family 65 protein [Zunongwangia sp. SCSIO 43204]UAB85652.1 glycoside hydrolase family 65 protein [Zunongwangia sp. SCSIO 43204]
METWKVIYNRYEAEKEKLREALCVLGNGYFATRGAFECCNADEIHYPGTYLAGGYNRLTTQVAGKEIENEDLVNFPNWLPLKFKIEDGDWITPENIKIESYKAEVHLKNGVLKRKLRFTDSKNRKTEWRSERIVSMTHKHRAAIKWELNALNWEGNIQIQSALDATVINSGVERYGELNNKHLETLDKGITPNNNIFIKVITNQSRVVMAQAARTYFYSNNKKINPEIHNIEENEFIAQNFHLKLQKNIPLQVEKHVSLFTSKDEAISEPLLEAKEELEKMNTFAELAKDQINSWEALWDQNDIEITSENIEDQLVLRFHVFHILQTYSANSVSMDTGIPARGWHGEAYRGHIFWDEMFTFPLFNISSPEISRSLLLYRYRRLPAARLAAKKAGFKGAMFPWQSGSNGREENQVIHLNPESGQWNPDNTYLQRHVNAAISYNVWTYFETTGDLEFLSFHGAEMMLEIAHFWSKKCHFSEEKNRYEIHQIVGPDEYHTQYPDCEDLGLKNNAYTNIMAVWSLDHALQALEKLDDLRVKHLLSQLDISTEELERWKNITQKMYVPFIENSGVIEQFEGFDKLEDLDWGKYQQKHGENMRLDRILGAEGDQVNKYKAVKQADVLMLFYLFSAEQIKDLLHKLGYDFDPKKHIPENIEYYRKITSHGSTLSQLVHSWVYARQDRSKSWHNFKKALMSDIKDVQGGTTPEGIHLGAMAGTINLIQECYTGMDFRKDALYFQPKLPDDLKNIKFRLRYLQHWIELELDSDCLRLKNNGNWHKEIRIFVRTKKFIFKPFEEKTILYNNL